MAVLGAIIGYGIGKFPDGGTPSSRTNGALLGFLLGASSAVASQRNCMR